MGHCSRASLPPGWRGAQRKACPIPMLLVGLSGLALHLAAAVWGAYSHGPVIASSSLVGVTACIVLVGARSLPGGSLRGCRIGAVAAASVAVGLLAIALAPPAEAEIRTGVERLLSDLGAVPNSAVNTYDEAPLWEAPLLTAVVPLPGPALDRLEQDVCRKLEQAGWEVVSCLPSSERTDDGYYAPRDADIVAELADVRGFVELQDGGIVVSGTPGGTFAFRPVIDWF